MHVDLEAVTAEARQAWSLSPLLRAEFGSEAEYLAYRRAEARGAVRILRAPGIVTGMAPQTQRFTLDAPLTLGAGAKTMLTADDRGRIRGYAAVFGTTNRKQSRILPGAFRGSLHRVPLVMLWKHDSDKPIGSWSTLSEDSIGLLADGEINLNVAAGRDAFALIRAGDVSGLSVGIAATRDGFKVVDDVLEFSAVDLYEISVAPVPAEDLARITNVGA